MTRRGWRIPSRKIGPGSTGTKDPENGIENVSGISPRPTSLWAAPQPLPTGKEPANDPPLLVGNVHPNGRSRTRSCVDPPRGVMRYALVGDRGVDELAEELAVVDARPRRLG